MPQINNVTVTRQAVLPVPAAAGVVPHPGSPAATWQPGIAGTTNGPGYVAVNFNPHTPPPAGFFNNPDSTYIVTGTMQLPPGPYASHVLQAHNGLSDPANGVIILQ